MVLHCLTFVHGVHKGARSSHLASWRKYLTIPGEMVFSDLCGPFRIRSIHHNRYYRSFIDGYSRYAYLYFCKTKDDILPGLNEFRIFLKSKGFDIRGLFSDHGREYVASKTQQYLHNHNIVHITSAIYTPEQNSIAERYNRTINEGVRTLLLYSKQSPNKWDYAARCVKYVRNLLPSRALDYDSPYMKLTGLVPDISHLRIWGCDCIVMHEPPNPNVLETTGYLATFLGYAEHERSYICLSWETKEIKYSCNVVFNETSIYRDMNKFKNYINPFKIVNKGYHNQIVTFQMSPRIERPRGDDDDDDLPHDVTPEQYYNGTSRGNIPDIDNVDSVKDISDTIPVIRRSTRVREPPKRLTYTMLTASEFPGIIPTDIQNTDFYGSDTNIELPLDNNIDELMSEAPSVSRYPPQTVDEAILSVDHQKWLDSMQLHINQLNDRKSWLIVPIETTNGRPLLDTKWIFKYKEGNRYTNFNMIYKSRFVIKGYRQQYGVDYYDIYAPVARKDSIRIFFSIATQEGMYVRQLDVVTLHFPMHL